MLTDFSECDRYSVEDRIKVTMYEVMVTSGQDRTPAVEFTTAPATRIPNGSFEYASFVSGTNYYKFYDPYCGVA